MKICTACGAHFEAATWLCPHCGHTVPLRDGVVQLGPASASAGEGFPRDAFGSLAAAEAGSFWFRARNRLILWALRRYVPKWRSLLEVGCGTGYVLAGIKAEFPDAVLCGSELFAEGLKFAAARLPGVELIQLDARCIPFVEHFDVVGAFDVLEHIEDDRQALSQAHRALVSGGSLLITVPQHKFLWSKQDEMACHVRRYSASELHGKVEAAGFRVVRMTSFVSLLLPVMFASRLRKRRAGAACDGHGELVLPGTINAALEGVMTIERALIRCGVSFPAGGSLLLIARKN